MKTVLVMIVFCLGLIFGLSGCGAEGTAAGGGLLGGMVLSNTIEGMQKDLAVREAALVERYNNLIAAGAKAEDLEQVKEQIATIQVARQAGQTITDTDWTDPAAVGGGLGTLVALVYALFERRGKKNTLAGVKSFRAGQTEDVKRTLDQVMLSNRVPT